MCLCGLSKKKKNIIFHILYIIVASPFWNVSIFQSSSFYEARLALIGQLSSGLWLAEYLKREMEMLRPLPYCDSVSRYDDTITIKTHYKWGICCIQWGHNYWL